MIVCPWKDIGRYAAVIPGLEEAIKAVSALTDLTPRTVPLSGGNRILVQQGSTKPAEGAQFEAHRNYLDIQCLVQGEEVMGWAPLDSLTPAGDYNEAKDKQMLTGHADFMTIGTGCCYVVFPEDGHMPGVHLDQPHSYTKLVIKLAV